MPRCYLINGLLGHFKTDEIKFNLEDGVVNGVVGNITGVPREFTWEFWNNKVKRKIIC